MATPLYPPYAPAVESLLGYNGQIVQVGVNQGAANNNALAAFNGMSNPSNACNPQQSSDPLDGDGDLSSGGPGGTGGQDPPGTFTFYAGVSGSGSNECTNCMTCWQIANSLHPEDCLITVTFGQPYCDHCHPPQPPSPTNSMFSPGPDASDYTFV